MRKNVEKRFCIFRKDEAFRSNSHLIVKYALPALDEGDWALASHHGYDTLIPIARQKINGKEGQRGIMSETAPQAEAKAK